MKLTSCNNTGIYGSTYQMAAIKVSCSLGRFSLLKQSFQVIYRTILFFFLFLSIDENHSHIQKASLHHVVTEMDNSKKKCDVFVMVQMYEINYWVCV